MATFAPLRRTITMDSTTEEIQAEIREKFPKAINGLNARSDGGRDVGDLVERLNRARSGFQAWSTRQRSRPLSEQVAQRDANANLRNALRCLSRIVRMAKSNERLATADIEVQLGEFNGCVLALQGSQEDPFASIREELEEGPDIPGSLPRFNNRNGPNRHSDQTQNTAFPRVNSYEPQTQPAMDRDVWRNIKVNGSGGQFGNQYYGGSTTPRRPKTYEGIEITDSQVHLGDKDYGPPPLDQVRRSQTVSLDPREPDVFNKRRMQETRRAHGEDAARERAQRERDRHAS